MAVLHARYELLKEKPGLVLAEAPGLDNPVEQLPTSSILHSNAEMARREEHLCLSSFVLGLVCITFEANSRSGRR